MVLGGRKLEFIPAHYLHASANFHLYDVEAKVYFFGRCRSCAAAARSQFWVEAASVRTRARPSMRTFSIPGTSMNAGCLRMRRKKNWIDRVRQLDIDLSLPTARCDLCRRKRTALLEFVRRTNCRYLQYLAEGENNMASNVSIQF